MHIRHGVTLVEVLAAIGIMGIGMLAILVLFPLGALSMARALKDDRCGAISWNADSLCTALDYRNDPQVRTLVRRDYVPLGGASGLPPADPQGPGYAVYIDPHYNTRPVPPRTLPIAGDNPSQFLVYPTVPRVTPQNLATLPPQFVNDALPNRIERFFTFNDDMGFAVNGFPRELSDGRYTWAYLLQRLQSGNARTTQVWVVVYSGRPIEVPEAEEAYAAIPAPVQGDTSVVLNWAAGQKVPEFRRGHWLLATGHQDVNRGGQVVRQFRVQFHRIVDVAAPVGNAVELEIQPPLQFPGVTQMVSMTGAVEVFERGAER
jgi:prepilin-type N-terminal cleavage/methylation domain-containing protein